MRHATAFVGACTLVVSIAAWAGCERKKPEPARPWPAPVYLVLPSTPSQTDEPTASAEQSVEAPPAGSSGAGEPVTPAAPSARQELSPEAWLQRAAVAAWSGERDRERATRSFSSDDLEPDDREPGVPLSIASAAPSASSSADIEARVQERLAEEREKQRAADAQEKRAQEARRQQEQRQEELKRQAQQEADRKQFAATYGGGPGFTGVGGGTLGFTGIGAGSSTFTGFGAGDSGFTGFGAGSTTPPSGYTPGVFTGPIYWFPPMYWPMTY